MKDFLKIAHRGYSEIYPENTILAFEKAIEFGVDIIELDIHLSKDGHIVIIHDNDVDRTSDGHGEVKDFTLRELLEFDFGHETPFESKGISIPTLEEVIDLAKGRVLINIEIKNCPYRYPGIEEKLISLLRFKDFESDVIVSSFDHFSIMKIKNISSDIKTGMLYDAIWVKFLDEIIILQPYSVHPSIDAVDFDQLKRARELGCRVFPWLARSKKTIKSLKKSSLVDGVMVNDLMLFN